MTKSPRDALSLISRTYLKGMDNPILIALVKLRLGEAIRRPVVAEMIDTIGQITLLLYTVFFSSRF